MLIDLHAHVLHGVDDGPRTLAEAVALCRQAWSAGTTALCACPHAPRNGVRDTALVLDRLDELREALTAEGIPLEVAQGMEYGLEPGLERLVPGGAALTLAKSRYLAVEAPSGPLPFYTSDLLFRLSVTGAVPILLHPERNAEIAAHPERFEPLARQGVVAVLSGGSLVGEFGRHVRRAAETLLANRWVHGVVSDGHDLLTRPATLRPALLAACRLLGPDAARALAEELPKAVLADRPYETSPLPLSGRAGSPVTYRRLLRRTAQAMAKPARRG